MLDRNHTARGEAAAVADAINLIDDGNLRVAAQQEICVKGVRGPVLDIFDGAAGGDQRLTDHLTAEYPLPPDLRRTPPKQIRLELLEIEDGKQILHSGGHGIS